MNSFEKHSIKHLSASSLSLFRTQPALWCLKYLIGFKDDAGAAAWRGSAVESGLASYLYKKDLSEARAASMARFEKDAMGDASDEVESERQNIIPMLDQSISAASNIAVPTASQLRIETWLDGVDVPVIGYMDFLCDGVIIDLKSTKACPSAIKPEHNRQVALYLHSRGYKETGKILYVTAKKHAWYDVLDAADAISSLTKDARALQRFLGRVDSGRDAVGLLAPDLDHFMWSDTAKQALQQAQEQN